MTTSKTKYMGLVTVIVTSPDDVDNLEMKNIKEQVREIMDHIEEYNRMDNCEEFLRSTRYEYIFIIATSNSINNVFAQNLHQVRHVQSILLFDPDQQMNLFDIDRLRKSSYKMQERFIYSNDLVKNLWKCVHECVHHSDVLLSSLSGCSLDAMTTNVVNNIADFAELWFPLYIDLLLELPVIDPDNELQKFVSQSRKHFSKNPGALQIIDGLEEIYTPSGALYYYSGDTIIYRLINRALRRQAIDAILDFRFFLLDIRNQLQTAHREFLDENTKVGTFKTFFRGQRMTLEEIKALERKHIDGTLITTNSYFSTSEDIEVARVFAGKPTAATVCVLFEVTAKIKDPDIPQRKPFAKIGGYSQFGEAEREVLFSIGSFFKIDKIYETSPSFWTIQMTIIDEDDNEKQVVIEDYRTLRTCSAEAKVIKIGHLLANHPQQGISQAKAFHQLMTTSKFSDTLVSACTAGLGWLALKERNGELAILLQQQALRLYEQLPRSNNENYAYLYVTSYNCIGASCRLMKRYRRALEYYKRAEESHCQVLIDKYAMYQGYRNITSINIASVQKLMGDIDLAWESYKKILAYEMNSSIRFHGHTYLTIAQAGLYEAKLENDQDEYDRCSQSWKAFLDKSLTNMTSNYRRSIISGVLLIGFEYTDNEQRRGMAMDYFQKLVHISRRYVHVNPDDYEIVLKCLNQLARLNTRKGNYTQSVNHVLEALNTCKDNKLADIKECYESLLVNYEQQLLVQTNDLTPEDISKMILENPFTYIEKPMKNISNAVLMFKRDEFAFGQCLTKTINPNVLQEPDLQRCLAYCRLKVATLAQARAYHSFNQAKLNDDHLLRKEAEKDIRMSRSLLEKVAQSFKNNHQIQKICMNNRNYLDEDFDSIIHMYKEDLNNYQHVQEKDSSCIGEDAFSYIAHLYSRKQDREEEHRWYNDGIKYFERHGHICEHTVVYFQRVVYFHEKHQNDVDAIDVLQRLADYLLQHSRHSFLRTSIKSIVTEIIQYFGEKEDRKQVIILLRDLIDLILIEPADDVCRIDEQFRKLIKKCKDNLEMVNRVYESYLEMLLRYKPLPSDSYIRTIEPIFRQGIESYYTRKKYQKSIETYQQFIELLIKKITDHQSIEAAFKRLALDFEALHFYDIALDMYSYLGNFIVKHKKEEDILLAGFVIVRCKLLKTMGVVFTDTNQSVLIQLIIFYHNIVTPQFVLMEYRKSIYAHVDRRSSSGIYISLLELCFHYRSEFYENHMKTNVLTLANRPTELIAFITTNRANYKELILHIFGAVFKEQTEDNLSLKKSSSDFETAANEWTLAVEKDRRIYWGQLLHRLLELQSIDDEYLAIAYIKIGDIKTAISLFTKDVYEDLALRFNSNACRRYLRYVYPYGSADERIYLEHRYQRHLFAHFDSSADQMSYEILPNE